MIIDMLTRWLNFEFWVLSHLKNSQPTTIAMVAPSSDQRQKA